MPPYMSHGHHQVVNRTTPYIHTHRKEHPLGQLFVRLEQGIETTKGNGSSQRVRRRTNTHSDISLDNGNWSGSEWSNGRKKGTPAVYGVTADIGINLCGGVFGDIGTSGTALMASNASVNQRWGMWWFVQLQKNERYDVHSPNLCRDFQASPDSW